jgi:hypothetical protein
MRTSKPWFSAAIIAIAAVLFAAPTPSHADTYQVFDLGPTGQFTFQRGPVGIEASGAAVIFADPEACGQQAPPYICYETWVNGALVSKSATNPNSVYDNGTYCTPDAPAGFYIGYSLCNNGHEVYLASLTAYPNQYPDSIFTGPDPVTDFFANGTLSLSFLNSSGDFLYTSGQIGPISGEIYEAIDLTTTPTPEPGSFFLLGTGALTGLAAIRRRLLQHG